MITEAELRFGVRRRPEATRLARAVDLFLRDIPCLPWTSETAGVYATQRAKMEALGVGLSAMDLLIATHALAEGCTLVSADRAFTKVPGLRVLDCSGGGPSSGGAQSLPATKGTARSVKKRRIPGADS